MQTRWEAQYLDGTTPQPRRADVQLFHSGLEVRVEGSSPALWRYAEIRQTQGRYAGEQVRLERGDAATPELLLVRDRAFLESLHGVAGPAAARFATPRDGRRRGLVTALAGLAAAGLLAALYLWAVPGVAGLVAPRVPASWEIALGDAVLPYLAPPARRCAVPALDTALAALVSRLTAPLGATPYPFHVVVVRDARVNAWALPGGRIVLLSGLLEGSRSAEELAAVLAHELQHTLRRHATRALLEHASAGLLLAAVTGDASGLVGYGVDAAQRIAMLRYSRRHEEEADAEGLRMLIAARIDPGAMIAFLERLESQEGRGPAVPAYLSTHPETAVRIARLRTEAAAHRFPPLRLPAVQEWSRLRAACR